MKFLNLAEITFEVSILIICISLIRSLFRKRLNPNVQYFLWVFVAVRILIPFKLDYSLKIPESWNFNQENNTEDSVPPEILSEGESVRELSVVNLPKEREYYGKEISINHSVSLEIEQIFFLFWLCGAFLMAFYIFLNNRKLFMVVKADRREIRKLSNGIILYEMPGYNCLMGIFPPAIYVDIEGLNNPAAVEDVIRHELQHYRVKDNYWQALRVLCLVLQWHNPLMWWAYFVSQKDCEAACDARVVKSMSKEERYEYGRSLLAVLECVVKKKQNIGFHTSMGTDKKFVEERINAIMKYKPKKTAILSAVIIMLIGCVCLVSFHITKIDAVAQESAVAKEEVLKEKTSKKEIEGIETENIPQTESQPAAEIKKPTKEEVLKAREYVLEGMTEEEIERLKENIKVANQRMESAYLNENIFKKLEDTESLYWNYFDKKGDIQIGWADDGVPVMVYNRFHAENFINLLEEMKETVQNEKLREDLQKIMDETALAAETHEMEHALNIYKLLHDMDYYLFRYGPEDVGKYVRDTSTISKYYGVLSVYDEFYNADDTLTASSLENIVRTKTNILPNQTEKYRGGWSLGEDNQVSYSLLCLIQVVFEDGTVWDNPDYENWFNMYAGKEIGIEELQDYYPHEYKIELD